MSARSFQSRSSAWIVKMPRLVDLIAGGTRSNHDQQTSFS
jgi:hypothetical protein